MAKHSHSFQKIKICNVLGRNVGNRWDKLAIGAKERIGDEREDTETTWRICECIGNKETLEKIMHSKGLKFN